MRWLIISLQTHTNTTIYRHPTEVQLVKIAASPGCYLHNVCLLDSSTILTPKSRVPRHDGPTMRAISAPTLDRKVDTVSHPPLGVPAPKCLPEKPDV